MFEHWSQFATEYATRIGLTPRAALAAHAMICTTLGGDWLEEQERRTDLPSRTVADLHPLLFAMRGRTESCVAEVCELASYLLAFRNDPALCDIILALRDNRKCESAIQELAYAWKMRNAGAIVRLGPKTATGVADFGATFGESDHIVEVSGFPNNPFQSDLMAFTSAAQHALASGKRKSATSAPLAIEIIIGQMKVYADLRKLHAPVHAAIVEVIGRAVKAGEDARRTYGFGEVRVRRAGPHEVPDANWSIAACLTLVQPDEVSLVGQGIDYRRGKDTDWIYLRVPDEVRDPYAKIRAKLKIESRQLRGCTDGVIILDATGLMVGTPREDDARLREIIDDFSEHHTSTTGVAIVTMPQKWDGTAGIAGAYFPLGPTALPKAAWDKLVRQDEAQSVLRELAVLG